MPTPRCSLSANVVDGKIYLIGGDVQNAYTTNSVNINEVYNPANDSWTEAAAIPYAVDNYASAVADNKIYVIGGGAGSGGNEGISLNQIYDPATNTWSQGAPIPVPTWDAAAGATTGAHAPVQIYVMGGNPTENSNINYAYDPETNTWTNAASMPNGCYWPALAVVNDQLYVIGGGQNHVTYYASLTTNEQYTPIGYTAASLTDQPPSSSPEASPSTSMTPSVPEFPTWVILPFFAIAVLLSIVFARKRNNVGRNASD
jgi:N-acetylneuraminic acid mutarotase